MRRRWIITAAALVLLAAGGLSWFLLSNRSSETAPTADQSAPPSFNKQQYSIDDPNSIWVVVNKLRPLPEDYLPTDLAVPQVKLAGSPLQELMMLREPAAKALEELYSAAKAQGIEFMLFSGYRTPAYQKQLYDNYVALNSQEAADKFSARPNYSEHQTGLAADLSGADGKCQAESCFADLPEAKWLADHAHEFGFILTYREGKEAITGYEYEPWHVRYVGKELAAELKKTSETLEEFFGLPPAPDYKQ